MNFNVFRAISPIAVRIKKANSLEEVESYLTTYEALIPQLSRMHKLRDEDVAALSEFGKAMKDIVSLGGEIVCLIPNNPDEAEYMLPVLPRAVRAVMKRRGELGNDDLADREIIESFDLEAE